MEIRTSAPVIDRLNGEVISPRLCVGCGACVACAQGDARMRYTDFGPVPEWSDDSHPQATAIAACPGIGIDYPGLYRKHYGHLPENWLTGIALVTRTGHATDPAIRLAGASGGVITRVLVHLLETGEVDGIVAVRQGTPTPEEARAVICTSREEILACAQSVYIPVSVLDVLRQLEPGKRYAMTCLPDQSAALRVLQQAGHPTAQQVRFLVGPYTGTALLPAAIRAFLRSKGIGKEDAITRLRWRAGEWPGYLEIEMASGRIVRSRKVYYNFLIPFFITRASLQSMDFANEFADLAVGDAWSKEFEDAAAATKGEGGHSVLVTRSKAMEEIVAQMAAQGLLTVRIEDARTAYDMHGHMLDFKKRGGYLRNRWRRATGRRAPDYGYRPARMPVSRIAVEVVISGIFAVGGLAIARWVMSRIPQRVLGPTFDFLRRSWKSLSKPTKRKGLSGFGVVITGEAK